MTIIKIVSFIVLVIACAVIYHNTNAYEPKKRIIYIIVGMIVMYGVTCFICGIKSGDIAVHNQEAINETLNVIKMIFTPINAMIILAPIGNIFGKAKERNN